MSKNGCRVQSWEGAPNQMYFSFSEKKKDEKSRPKKVWRSWNKKISYLQH